MERQWRGVVFIATSVDGFIARNDDDIGWLTEPDSTISHMAEIGDGSAGDYDEMRKRVDHLVMGRGTYEKVLTFDAWPFDNIPVVVLSTSLRQDADTRVAVVRSVAECVQLLDERRTTGVYVDGGKTIQAFLDADLIDEITITRAPVLIGSGIPLFGSIQSDVRLSLQAVAAKEGYLHARYEVVRA
jgi:dihydrofolate reductase